MKQMSQTCPNKAAVKQRHSNHKTYPLIHWLRGRGARVGQGRRYCYISLDAFLLCGLLTSCHVIVADCVTRQPLYALFLLFSSLFFLLIARVLMEYFK